MPETVTVTPAVAPSAPPVTPTEEPTTFPMVTGKLRREKGRALLTLDVSRFHTYLETLGVGKDNATKMFLNAPASRSDVLDTTQHALVPKALCSFAYKADSPGILEIDLLRCYTTPPTEPTLKIIAESVRDAAIAVITHYQPVEIPIVVMGKKPR